MMEQSSKGSAGNRPRGRGGRGFPWWRATVLVAVAGAVAFPYTSTGEKVLRALNRRVMPEKVESKPKVEEQEDLERQVEARLREEFEEKREQELAALRKQFEEKEKAEREGREQGMPPLDDHTAVSGGNVRLLRSGIPFSSKVEVSKGGVASKERKDAGSYAAEYVLKLRLPAPAKSLEELQAVNPKLGALLPGLEGMLANAEVSRWYYTLYEKKTERIKRDANLLSEVLTKHNLYDCETMLYMKHPQTKRAVFLLQAEMDVVSDGSDGDRLPEMPAEIVNSTHYQPFTSYGWPKRTRTPNPMVAGWEKRVGNAEKELADPKTDGARKAWLRDRIKYLKRGIQDMKGRSFLVAEYDPFIVIPVNLLSSADTKVPKVGDYAVVIHGERIFPAIVGDGGPDFKVGEASLRMAKEINARATPYARPESDLVVTYLVFPGSREERREPPDYAKWKTRCEELLGEIGGVGAGVALHEWKNLLPDTAPPEASPPTPASAPPTPEGGR